MKAQGLSVAAIAAFKRNYDQLVAGVTGLVTEAEISPAADLPYLAGMAEAAPHSVKVLITAWSRMGPWEYYPACPHGHMGKDHGTTQITQ